MEAVGADAAPPVVACIGPVTAATAREHGLTVDVEADVHTVDGLVDALVAWAPHVTLDAVVFDFDGLIIDSEWAIFETAHGAFAVHGHELTVEAWATIVGLGDDDDELAWSMLTRGDGHRGVRQRGVLGDLRARRTASNRDSLPLLPGIEVLVDSLVAAGVPIGVASSSSLEWLDRHLGRLGLRDRGSVR